MRCEHTERPVYSRELCRPCYEKDLRMRNPEFAERQRVNARQWTDANRERKREGGKSYAKRIRTPEYNRRKYAASFGLTVEVYAAYLAEPCGICGGKSRHLDHDHACCKRGCSKCIRGGLCHRCNIGLGFYEKWFKPHEAAALAWLSRATDRAQR